MYILLFCAAAPTAPDHIIAPLWSLDSSTTVPEPIRGGLGAKLLGPHNTAIEKQNLDQLAPPLTDNGQIPNNKWSFALSRTSLFKGGWSRQQTVTSLPVATDIAGVNMRLEAGAMRELHWHRAAEWAYVLAGDIRVSSINSDGEIFVGDVSAGDLWYFPSGIPHSLQAKTSSKDGAEFILVFDNGEFSEDSTFQLIDWMIHTPLDVLAKNFGVEKDLAALDHLPKTESHIFPAPPPAANIEDDQVIPNDTANPYIFHLSQSAPYQRPGGNVKVVDQRNFTVADKISAVEVTVNPGGMRELHWHPTQPEWTFFIAGHARVTVFVSSAQARTYDFQAGDVGYFQPSVGHYVENTGSTPLRFLEVFKSNRAQDISLTQWLALTPKNLVKAHTGFSDELLASLSHEKLLVV
ncbi:putative oxalate decarboxylase/oxidase [Mycena floridula]|nr:putative oxalate decarboxylase/oxidase [Mycena floridula]